MRVSKETTDHLNSVIDFHKARKYGPCFNIKHLTRATGLLSFVILVGVLIGANV
jgi:hypothetical protein